MHLYDVLLGLSTVSAFFPTSALDARQGGRSTHDDLIDLEAVERAHDLVLSVLDTEFFHVRFERATPLERRYLGAMAELGEGPQRSGDVTRRLGYGSTTETGAIRDSLIKKGLVFSPRHGIVDFTVPFFGDFMRRQHPLSELGEE